MSSFTLHYLIFNFHIFLYIYNVFSLAHIVLFFLLRFLTKKDCLNAMDPYCGWNRNKEECTTAPNRNPRVATWQQNVLSCPVLTDPVDGVWTAWSAWDQCAFSNPDRRVDSGGDYCMCRRRTCTAPPPANGGAGCEGPGLVVGAVRMVECPTCGKLFRSQEGLAVHVAKDHEVSVLLLLL